MPQSLVQGLFSCSDKITYAEEVSRFPDFDNLGRGATESVGGLCSFSISIPELFHCRRRLVRVKYC